MRIARVGTGYIVVVWLVVVVMLGSVLYLGYRRNVADLRQLMMNEAERLIGITGIASQAGIHALDEVEDLTARRLLDNAQLIERLSHDAIPSEETLAQIARENDLHMINILDAAGKSIVRSGQSDGPARGEKTGETHRPEVEAVLSGDDDQGIIGFMDGRYYSGKRYGVVVGRENGGAVVVNADSGKMLAFRRSVGLGTLFRDIGRREGIVYIVLQDGQGIVAASGGVREMTRIGNDPFLLQAEKGEMGSRLTRYRDRNVLEVASPLIADDYNLGIIRLGLSTDEIDGIRMRAVRQFLLLFAAAMFSGALVLVFVILKQNYMILDAEHDRILGEVRRMEEEQRRTERLASMGRLAAGVAHEIRNPLNAVSIITQRLRAEFTPTGEEAEYRKYLATVASEIARISQIVEQFLKYAKPPKLSITEVNLSVLIGEVTAIAGERARTNGIAVSANVSRDIVCRCDADQLKQALLNLSLNAVEACTAGGSVTVAARKNGGEIVLVVRDTGGGIADDAMPKIFDPYF
ncbi:MAG: hypothetical protein J7M24_03780, partial [Candidatus Latescibacteria bacterium]|nr:hypothetical protein [Candidatus Latescibacterota bacterium]